MAYVVTINIDHENHPAKACAEVWEAIEAGMLRAGFHSDGRKFTINLSEQAAVALARRTMMDIESSLERIHRPVNQYLKDFYGYDMECVTNLMLPPVETIEVT